MGNEILIDQIVSPGAFKQIDDLSSKLEIVIKQMQAMSSNKTASIGGDPKTIDEAAKATRQLSLEQQKLNRLNEDAGKLNYQKSEAIKDEIRLTKLAEQAVNPLINAYKNLSAQAALATEKAKNLAAKVALGDTSLAGASKIATAEAFKLNNQLKTIDAGMDLHQRNVGNYSSALGTLSRTARGLGGLGRIIGNAIGIDVTYFDDIREAGRALRDLKHIKEADKLQDELGTKTKIINTIAVEENTTANIASTASIEAENEVTATSTGIWSRLTMAVGAAGGAILVWAGIAAGTIAISINYIKYLLSASEASDTLRTATNELNDSYTFHGAKLVEITKKIEEYIKSVQQEGKTKKQINEENIKAANDEYNAQKNILSLQIEKNKEAIEMLKKSNLQHQITASNVKMSTGAIQSANIEIARNNRQILDLTTANTNLTLSLGIMNTKQNEVNVELNKKIKIEEDGAASRDKLNKETKKTPQLLKEEQKMLEEAAKAWEKYIEEQKKFGQQQIENEARQILQKNNRQKTFVFDPKDIKKQYTDKIELDDFYAKYAIDSLEKRNAELKALDDKYELAKFDAEANGHKLSIAEEKKYVKERQKIMLDYIKSQVEDIKTMLEGIVNAENFGFIDNNLTDAFKTSLDGVTKLVDNWSENTKENIKDVLKTLEPVINDVFKALSDSSTQQTETIIKNIDDRTNAEIDALKLQLDAGIITQEQYNIRTKQLNEDKAAEEKKIKHEQFEKDRKYAEESIAIQTLVAIAMAWATATSWVQGLIVSALLTAQGAAEIAIVAGRKNPYFMGRIGGKSEDATVGEMGFEYITTSTGIYKTPDKMTPVHLNYGDSVIPHEASLILDKYIGMPKVDQITKVRETQESKEILMTLKAIEKKPQAKININKHEFGVMIGQGNNWVKWSNNRVC